VLVVPVAQFVVAALVLVRLVPLVPLHSVAVILARACCFLNLFHECLHEWTNE
jgi:hypothetical protein